MRRFKLINANGAEWDLMRRDAFFHAPSGLGMSRMFSVSPAGYDFLETDDELSQKTINGEMIFRSYDLFGQFVSFVNSDPLTLCYAPGEVWYRISCKISTISKGERSGPVLIAPISFICFGTWRENIEVRRSESSGQEQKQYIYTYPYKYSDTDVGSVLISNGGLESPCRLHIFGPATNPAWSVYKGGKLLSNGRVNITIPEGNKLVVDAVPRSMQIAEYTKDNLFVADKYQNSDFSTARFVYVPPGESKISFTHEGTGDLAVYVEVERLAYTV